MGKRFRVSRRSQHQKLSEKQSVKRLFYKAAKIGKSGETEKRITLERLFTIDDVLAIWHIFVPGLERRYH